MTEKQHIAAFPAEDGKDWARKILIRIRDGNPPCSYAVNLARQVLRIDAPQKGTTA